eukprot:CAMPEP_0171335080 /NCGR_PEP_ID=MMETSP0878-20121228/5096_1 /TAXON_ID=67004 /ORGANISM="Thalassiosira weissflogii, Strain CCMP1336" /LENGTH=361 /DNA_ID=CAMNT_0011836291 /DNA_START=254 /DNA_END=1336 /DNA_ORIENTATION=-
MADGSDYKADKSDFDDGSDDTSSSNSPSRGEDDMASVPVTEEIPVPMSRNNVGNRFVCVVMDRDFRQEYFDLEDENGDFLDFEEEEEEEEDGESNEGQSDVDKVLWHMHDERVALTEDHVLWARKQNLYNETFNTESMADILWSHQILSSDLQRAIGHVMCIDSPSLADCREALSRDPIIRSLLSDDNDPNSNFNDDPIDVSSIPLYRWRHIRDHTLRRDDGRDGTPHLLLAFDRPEARSDGLREEIFNNHLEYLIRSERIIASGPLHVATEKKTDGKSIVVGTLLLFNARDREDAVDFVENDPAALAGLYETMTVHRYNSLDVTGKFVSENLWFPKQNTYQMKEAMEYWGYPVDDEQTKW